MHASDNNNSLDEDFTNNYNFQHLSDTRSQSQITQHHQLYHGISTSNIQVFNFGCMPRLPSPVPALPLLRVSFADGCFVHVTDNGRSSPYTLFCVHGTPGDHNDWTLLSAYLGTRMRVISFVIPGFDGVDERRGQYRGSLAEAVGLMVRVLGRLGAGRAIYCGHSNGTIMAGYALTVYPHVFRGYVNLGGISNIWNTGGMAMFRTAVHECGFSHSAVIASRRQLLDQDQFREAALHKHTQASQQIQYSPGIPFKPLKKQQLCAMLRLTDSTDPQLHYRINRQIHMLRVVAHGAADPLVRHQIIEEHIHSITRGANVYRISSAELRARIERRIKEEHGMEVDAGRLQDYFCFLFEGTGHNVHKKRARELSRIIRVYATVVEEMDGALLGPTAKL